MPQDSLRKEPEGNRERPRLSCSPVQSESPRRRASRTPLLCHDEDMKTIRSLLEDKRRELEAELDRLAAPPEQTSGISFGKRVGEGTSMAVDRLVEVEVHEQMQAQLSDVRRALAKLDDGSYGTCDRCGANISPERLEVLPWAVHCVACAARR